MFPKKYYSELINQLINLSSAQVHDDADGSGERSDAGAGVPDSGQAAAVHGHLALVAHSNHPAAEPGRHPAQTAAQGGGVAQEAGIKPRRRGRLAQ